MAELRDASSDVVYRPLSALAVAGFGISCLFGGVVALSALIAIIQGAPFFFPSAVMLIPVGGFGLSWWGLGDIRNSEGTKAGRKLAVAGMWISLASGAGYFAFAFFTGVALEQQAQAFFLRADQDQSGFFPRLQNAGKNKVDFNRAFLMTMPYSSRTDIRPEDDSKIEKLFDQPTPEGAPSRLGRFRVDQMVATLLKNGPEATVESLGVKEWTYEKGSYRVTCSFRITGPEGSFDFLVTAVSTEGESESLPRHWFADVTTAQFSNVQLTALGKGMEFLRGTAAASMNRLEADLRKDNKLQRNPPADATDWTRFPSDAERDYKGRLRSIFRGEAADKDWHLNAPSKIPPGFWEHDAEGRLSLAIPLVVILVNSKSDKMMAAAEVETTMRTKAAIDPVKIGAENRPVLPEWEFLQYKYQRVKGK